MLSLRNCKATSAAILVLLIAGLASTSPCRAAFITLTPVNGVSPSSVLLSDLVTGQADGVIVGDKQFTNFNYTPTGDVPPADRVRVLGILDDLGNLGIRFTGPFIDPIGNGGSDATILFRVTALDQGQLITDVHLAGNPNVLGNGGSASVTETFGGQNLLLDIYDDFGNLKLSDRADLPAPVRFLDVRKDILLFGGTGSATISIIDQTFSQVPEPTAIVLVLTGLAVSSGFVWRRKH